MKKHNNDYDKDSKNLVYYKKIEKHVLCRICRWVRSTWQFLRENRVYKVVWLVLVLYTFNAFSAVLSVFAYYFYFISTFNFSCLYTMVVKLLLDFGTLWYFLPEFVWWVLAFVLIEYLRRRRAHNRLPVYEQRNERFIEQLPIVTLIEGTMGTGKTTALSDMLLTSEVVFRDKAHELLRKNDYTFPNFPWINFENQLKREIKRRRVFNLVSCRRYVRFYERFYNATKKNALTQRAGLRHLRRHYGYKCKNLLFDYDWKRYGLTYNNGLNIVTLFDVLESYAQLYFLYVIGSSLMVSNYSVRSDMRFIDKGNFPLWDGDFFACDVEESAAHSQYAHILDYDVLRLGKKVDENNPNIGALEFGVVGITEVGKERGNALENKEMKKNVDEANPKNDLFDNNTKMSRHKAVVDFYPFIRIFTDEQRAASWGANARELAKIVSIEEKDGDRNALPLFWVEAWFYRWILRKFGGFYDEYRLNRGDNTLFMHLLKRFCSAVARTYWKRQNLYGFARLSVGVEKGTQDGDVEERKYYLCNRKVFARRFATDCHGGFFEDEALRSGRGLADLPTYKNEKASMEELKKQNSYFIREMLDCTNKVGKVDGGEKEAPKKHGGWVRKR